MVACVRGLVGKEQGCEEGRCEERMRSGVTGAGVSNVQVVEKEYYVWTAIGRVGG